MPETIVLADGTEREVPTAEELESLSASAGKLSELQTDLENTKKLLEEAENPNWKNLRNQVNSYKEKLKEKGFEIDDSGNVVEPPPQQMSPEQIREEAKSAARSFFIEDHVARSLEKVEPNSRELVKRHYDKLTAGENVDQTNFSSFMEAAIRAAGINTQTQKPASYGGGGGADPVPASMDETKRQNAVNLLKSLGYQFKNEPK